MAKDNKHHPVSTEWAKRIRQMWGWIQGFDGDNVRNNGVSAYVGGGGERAAVADPVPRGRVVRLTAMPSDGVYTAKEVYRDEDQAITDGRANLVFDGSLKPSKNATGYVYERTGLPGLIVGQIIIVRRKAYQGGQRWEFDAPACVVPVNVTQTGGTQGTVSTAASWTYDVYTKDGTRVLSAVSPQNQRPAVGEVIKGTKGYAQYEPSGGDGIPTFTLGLVNEVPDPFPTGQVPPPYTPGTPDPPYVPSGSSAADVVIWDAVNNRWVRQPTSVVSVITSRRVDASTFKLQYKTTSVRVVSTSVESGWTDDHTGAECS